MSEWQPIETAPKDGTSVIIFVPPNAVGEARIQGEHGEDGWWWAGNDPSDHWGDQVHPTHWMPLPEPPAPRTAA